MTKPERYNQILDKIIEQAVCLKVKMGVIQGQGFSDYADSPDKRELETTLKVKEEAASLQLKIDSWKEELNKVSV